MEKDIEEKKKWGKESPYQLRDNQSPCQEDGTKHLLVLPERGNQPVKVLEVFGWIQLISKKTPRASLSQPASLHHGQKVMSVKPYCSFWASVSSSSSRKLSSRKTLRETRIMSDEMWLTRACDSESNTGILIERSPYRESWKVTEGCSMPGLITLLRTVCFLFGYCFFLQHTLKISNSFNSDL